MRTVPTGTVTFLFTDVEGSARRWETAPDAMARSLLWHDEVLRTAIESHGGYVFATGGDAFGAAFSRAGDAVAAARAAQRGLRSGAGLDTVELRVRMGMHTGVTEERDENYFGAAVNRAARVMAAAHGGQTLASLATVSTLGDLAGITDLGRHRLRDLLAPEQLFLIDGQPSDHPPLRTLDAHDHNLPMFRSTVFGLEDLIDRVVAGLRAHGMLTLTGMGGVGKTRTALEVAARLMPQHELTRFVEFSRISDDAEVVRVLGESIGVDAPDLETVVSYLGVRDSLLILDNCEHVVDIVRDVVDELLRRCSDLVVLATSREPLGVEGEHVQPVPSLPLDPAMQLFMDRAAAVRPDLALNDESSRLHLEEICSRLDGIPLALELAAARVAHMSPADIAARLDERFVLLTGGRRRARQRHQTLQATMDWSYELLDVDERSLLRTVAVFTGGFDAEAAAAVWGRGVIETLDVLGSLVDWSLLSVTASGEGSRYATAETVRLYALERLVAEGEAERRRAAHADHYLDALRALDADELVNQTVAHGLYWPTGRPDRENHLAALEWFDQVGDLARVAELAGRIILAHGSARWADEEDRYLGRQDVADEAETRSDRSLYLAASALNANVFSRWHDELRFATLGLDTATGMVRLMLLMMADIAAWTVEPRRGPALHRRGARPRPERGPPPQLARPPSRWFDGHRRDRARSRRPARTASRDRHRCLSRCVGGNRRPDLSRGHTRSRRAHPDRQRRASSDVVPGTRRLCPRDHRSTGRGPSRKRHPSAPRCRSARHRCPPARTRLHDQRRHLRRAPRFTSTRLPAARRRSDGRPVARLAAAPAPRPPTRTRAPGPRHGRSHPL